MSLTSLANALRLLSLASIVIPATLITQGTLGRVLVLMHPLVLGTVVEEERVENVERHFLFAYLLHTTCASTR